MTKPGKPEVSVIIPVLNAADRIEQCLKAVFAQTHLPREVILIDGHSTDATVAKAEKFPVTIIHQDYGWAGAARQLGVEKAQGEYVALTDADCIPPPDWLKGLLGEFQPGVVGVGGGIENTGEGLWLRSANDVMGTFLGGGNSAQGRRLKNRRREKDLNAFNSIYHKGELVAAGGFNIHLSGADEAELGRRLQKQGRLLYTPDVVVIHDHQRGLKSFARQMYRYGRWRRESRVWALPAIPPLLVPLLLLSLLLTRWLLPAVVALYLMATIASGLRFALKHKDWRYLFSIPVVYTTQHTLFTIGFWRELLFPRRRRR